MGILLWGVATVASVCEDSDAFCSAVPCRKILFSAPHSAVLKTKSYLWWTLMEQRVPRFWINTTPKTWRRRTPYSGVFVVVEKRITASTDVQTGCQLLLYIVCFNDAWWRIHTSLRVKSFALVRDIPSYATNGMPMVQPTSWNFGLADFGLWSR